MAEINRIELEVGDKFPNLKNNDMYEVLEILGTGGFGYVYLVENTSDADHGRSVAKIPRIGRDSIANQFKIMKQRCEAKIVRELQGMDNIVVYREEVEILSELSVVALFNLLKLLQV